MPERYARLELEDSQGNESTTTGVFGTPFYLPAIEVSFNPGAQPLDRSDEQRGVDGRLTLAQNEYEPEGSVSMRAYNNYLGALLMALFGDVVTTVGDGAITDPDGNTIPAGAYRHVFAKLSGVTPKTFRLTSSYGDHWYQVRGGSLKSMGFSLDDDGVKVECDAMANYMSRLTVDPAFAPAYDAFAILPFRRRNVTLDWGVGTANVETVEFTFEQDLEYVRDLGVATGWPTDTERANSPEGSLRLGGSLTRRQIDDEDWEALIDAEIFAVTVLMESEQNIGATSYPYRMWIESPNVQYEKGELEGLKNQQRHEHNLDWVASNDGDGASNDFTVTLVNDTVAYE